VWPYRIGRGTHARAVLDDEPLLVTAAVRGIVPASRAAAAGPHDTELTSADRPAFKGAQAGYLERPAPHAAPLADHETLHMTGGIPVSPNIAIIGGAQAVQECVAAITDRTLDHLCVMLELGDTVIDGGNSCYRDDIARAKALGPKGIHYIDCGTYGGVWGLERGYCLMIGGDTEAVERLDPIFKTIAPGRAPSRTPRDASPAAPPRTATCTAARPAPATSSRWCTTASSTA